jgi:hypothetical protein
MVRASADADDAPVPDGDLEAAAVRAENASRGVPALDFLRGHVELTVDARGPVRLRPVGRPLAPNVRNAIFHGQSPFYPPPAA